MKSFSIILLISAIQAFGALHETPFRTALQELHEEGKITKSDMIDLARLHQNEVKKAKEGRIEDEKNEALQRYQRILQKHQEKKDLKALQGVFLSLQKERKGRNIHKIQEAPLFVLDLSRETERSVEKALSKYKRSDAGIAYFIEKPTEEEILFQIRRILGIK